MLTNYIFYFFSPFYIRIYWKILCYFLIPQICIEITCNFHDIIKYSFYFAFISLSRIFTYYGLEELCLLLVYYRILLSIQF